MDVVAIWLFFVMLCAKFSMSTYASHAAGLRSQSWWARRASSACKCACAAKISRSNGQRLYSQDWGRSAIALRRWKKCHHQKWRWNGPLFRIFQRLVFGCINTDVLRKTKQQFQRVSISRFLCSYHSRSLSSLSLSFQKGWTLLVKTKRNLANVEETESAENKDKVSEEVR